MLIECIFHGHLKVVSLNVMLFIILVELKAAFYFQLLFGENAAGLH